MRVSKKGGEKRKFDVRDERATEGSMTGWSLDGAWMEAGWRQEQQTMSGTVEGGKGQTGKGCMKGVIEVETLEGKQAGGIL